MLSEVVKAHIRSGRGGLLGPDTNRRIRMWELTLACGCRVNRNVRYEGPSLRRFGGHQSHSMDAARPHPKRARCEDPAHSAGGAR